MLNRLLMIVVFGFVLGLPVQGQKKAVLMVHFGTTHDDTRALTIDEMNRKAKDLFPDSEVREAYTSRIVIKRLGDRGIVKENTAQALKRLAKDGYTTVFVQPTTIIDGLEMESINRDVDMVRGSFKEIRVSTPLLYAPEDYKKVISILTENTKNDTAYLLIGHGTHDPATAQYAMMDYMLKSDGYANFFVGTIEGYPSMDEMLKQLGKSGLKRVVLVPFMLVAGEHAKNDILLEWKDALENKGYDVFVKMQGLGELAKIQDLYMDHLRFTSANKRMGIMEKKRMYQKTGEKLK